MNKYCGYFGCSFQFKVRPYATTLPYLSITNVIEVGFNEGRNLIVIGQVRLDYETEIAGKVNWCQSITRSR